MSTLGERIRIIRGTMSQKKFAAKLGVGRSTIAGYENDSNQPSLELLVQIARHGHVSMDWLSGNDALSTHDSEVLYHNPQWKEFLTLARQKNINPRRLTELVKDSLKLNTADS